MSLKAKNKITLKTVANRVGLAPCSVSAVLNNTPASRAIPPATKEKIFRAAAELNYRPNFWARSLRIKRTRMVAAVTGDFGRPSVARVIAAAQDTLTSAGYLLVLASINSTHSRQNLHFQERGIEGLIAVDVSLPSEIDLPLVAVNLEYLASPERIGNGLQAWLLELGVSAAEAIIQRIEATYSGTHHSKKREPAPKLLEAQFNPLIAASKLATSKPSTAKLFEARDGV